MRLEGAERVLRISTRFAAFPHMHQLGEAIQTEQSSPGGGLIGMAENVPWNFNTQVWFPIDATLHAGDTHPNAAP